MSKYFDKQSEQAIKLLAAANARKNTMESLLFSGLAGRDAFTFFDIDLSGYLLKLEAEDTYVALADFDQLVIEALKQDIVSTDSTVSISYTEEGYVDLSVSSTLEDYLTIVNAQKTYVASETVRTIVKLTLDEYDALTSKDSNTMYVITDEQSTTYLTREDADKLYQPIGDYATKSDLNSYVLTTYLTSNYYDKSYIDSLIKNIEGSVSSEGESSLKKSDFLTSGYWVVNYSGWSVDYSSNVAVGFKKDGTTETYLFTIPGATSQTAGVMTTDLYSNLNTLWQAYQAGDLTKGGGEGDGLTTGDVNNLINAALSGYATQEWVNTQLEGIKNTGDCNFTNEYLKELETLYELYTKYGWPTDSGEVNLDGYLKIADFIDSSNWTINYDTSNENNTVSIYFKNDTTLELLFSIPAASSTLAGVMTSEMYEKLMSGSGGTCNFTSTYEEELQTLWTWYSTNLTDYVKKSELKTINGEQIYSDSGGNIQISGEGTVDLSDYVKFTNIASNARTGVIKVSGVNIPSGDIQVIDPQSDANANRIYGLGMHPDGTAYVVVPWESGSGSGTVDLSGYVLKSDLTDSNNWILQQGEGEENVDGYATGIYVEYDDKNLFFIPFASEYSYGFVTSEDKVYLNMLKKYMAETNPNQRNLIPVKNLANFFGELYNDNAGLWNGDSSKSAANFYIYDFDIDENMFENYGLRISLASTSYAGVMSATDKSRLDDLWDAYQSGALGGGDGDINLSAYATKSGVVKLFGQMVNEGLNLYWRNTSSARELQLMLVTPDDFDSGDVTSTTHTLSNFNVVGSDDIINIKVLTSAEYSALTSKDSNTMYCITD